MPETQQVPLMLAIVLLCGVCVSVSEARIPSPTPPYCFLGPAASHTLCSAVGGMSRALTCVIRLWWPEQGVWQFSLNSHVGNPKYLQLELLGSASQL